MVKTREEEAGNGIEETRKGLDWLGEAGIGWE